MEDNIKSIVEQVFLKEIAVTDGGMPAARIHPCCCKRSVRKKMLLYMTALM